MLISILNLSHGALPDEDLQRVIRAINRQIAEDFEPYWSFGATLRLWPERPPQSSDAVGGASTPGRWHETRAAADLRHA